MSAALWLLRLLVIALVVIQGTALVAWSGPDVEARFAPVLTNQSSGAAFRSFEGDQGCWTWRFDKVRKARAIDANWTIRSGEKVYPYQRLRTVADSGPIGSSIPNRPVRAGQWTQKCIEIPPELRGIPFIVTGFTEYRTAATGRFWTIRQPAAEVLIP